MRSIPTRFVIITAYLYIVVHDERSERVHGENKSAESDFKPKTPARSYYIYVYLVMYYKAERN